MRLAERDGHASEWERSANLIPFSPRADGGTAIGAGWNQRGACRRGQSDCARLCDQRRAGSIRRDDRRSPARHLAGQFSQRLPSTLTTFSANYSHPEPAAEQRQAVSPRVARDHNRQRRARPFRRHRRDPGVYASVPHRQHAGRRQIVPGEPNDRDAADRAPLHLRTTKSGTRAKTPSIT